MSMANDLQRFVEAQQPIYQQVVRELAKGSKQSHWMWFVFPQLSGLAPSAMSQRYALSSTAEAVAYWQHPVLGPRLGECTQLVLDVEGRSAEEIFGMPDCLKFRSCMTLFAASVSDVDLFDRALKKYFDGQPDPRTLESLSSARSHRNQA